MIAIKLRKSSVCLIVCFILIFAGSVLHGDTTSGRDSTQPSEEIKPKVRGFGLMKIGSHYEPEPHYDKPFRIPETTMRFGAYRYFDPEDEEIGKPMWGYLRDDGRFFYVKEPYAPDGDSQYGLSGNYFVVDGGSGGSGICRSMYLFEYGRNSMRLLDVIEEGGRALSALAFMSDYPGKPAYGEVTSEIRNEPDVPVWLINEKDRHGRPLIRLVMVRDLPPPNLGPEKFEIFHIYLRIAKGKLRVALDPYLYETIFNSLGDGGGAGSRSNEYYASGFLAGKLTLAQIKAELEADKDRPWRLWLVDSLKQVKKWDRELHRRLGYPVPKIVEYKLSPR